MKYKEYRKLRSVPVEELSKEDQQKRKDEFTRRLKICRSFLKGIDDGYIPKHVAEGLPNDDPMKEQVNDARIIVNNVGGEA